ncbi:RuvX/YqgF family protein [Candidatus Gracilibacteria bacterium]|nr:RuvX/YqgF family protein [Candidatus Gracilibacteria bacterium]
MKEKDWLASLEAQNEGEYSKKNTLQNVLGVDFGKKFCGLAFSPDGMCIIPLEVVETSHIESRIQQILRAKKIQTIVFGLPILPDGRENSLCADIRQLAGKLQSLSRIEFVNERFSSQTVVSRAKRKDDLAAVRILEFAFSKKGYNETPSMGESIRGHPDLTRSECGIPEQEGSEKIHAGKNTRFRYGNSCRKSTKRRGKELCNHFPRIFSKNSTVYSIPSKRDGGGRYCLRHIPEGCGKTASL